jgi:protein gp37
MIFVCAHGDLFHEDVPDEWIDRVFAVMALCAAAHVSGADEAAERMRVRWLSMEPLLGAVDLRNVSTLRYRGAEVLDALTGTLEGMFGDPCATRLPPLNWIVLGGESGPGARPMHPDWARSVRDQCAAAGVPFFFKQWGAWAACPGPNEGHWPDDADGFCRLATGGRRGDPAGWPMQRVGKRAAGRLLDGFEHNGVPA